MIATMRLMRMIAIPLLLAVGAAAQAQDAPRQIEADGYTRYELLAPGSGKFRILYEISAVTPGATAYFNPIREGSVATDERVTDRATGKPLEWEVVGGAIAAAGGVAGADLKSHFIRVRLARPVPAGGGEARVLIDKTYLDPKSYFTEGEAIVFDRPLGVKRNSVVLPPGYELVSLNYPSQVIQEPDGRLKVSFWNPTPAPAPVLLKARPARTGAAAAARQDPEAERAAQSREIVYYLQPPETGSFDLTHDYTETRPGTRHYVNVVRAGSRVSNPSATNLDTGESLRWETKRGPEILKLAPDAGEVGADTEAVVFHFPPVAAGTSVRLRIAETYTDPGSYKLDGGTLVWRRTLGRPANAVVLPAGWSLTGSSMPAAISETGDGRTRLDFINPRPDQLDVLITARRRVGS